MSEIRELITNSSMPVYRWMLKKEKYIFGLFLLITLSQLWITRYVPSLDGPQHLLNASMFGNLMKGNELISTFYTVNSNIVGYWTGHFLLSIFTMFLPSWLAEKLFLTLYVLGMVYAFRFLVKSINREKGNFISYIIFPFVYHMFILLGYYAFSLAAIFFFVGFGYYIRHMEAFKLKHVLVFSILLFVLFLTHGLVYLFFGLSFVIFYIGISIHSFLREDGNLTLKNWLRRSAILMLAFLPSLFVWSLYIRNVLSLDSTVAASATPFKELLEYILRIRQLVGFHHRWESIAYIPLFILIASSSFLTIWHFIKQLNGDTRKLLKLFSIQHIWLIIAVSFILLYFLAPDRISAGSLTNRFALYFFFLIITWLSMQKFSKTVQVLSLFILLFCVTFARGIHMDFYHRLNRDIKELTALTEHMEPNTIVDYRQASNNWVHGHFQLYAALDAPYVHLRNVQLWGQFPMVWDYETLPRCFAGEREITPSGAIKVGEDHPAVQIDYYTVFFKEQFWNDSTNLNWHKVLREDYEEIFVSGRNKAALYKRKE
ncbi:hypothetical protein ACFLT1_07620 [Bacteroidota bacterium]